MEKESLQQSSQEAYSRATTLTNECDRLNVIPYKVACSSLNEHESQERLEDLKLEIYEKDSRIRALEGEKEELESRNVLVSERYKSLEGLLAERTKQRDDAYLRLSTSSVHVMQQVASLSS